MKLIPQMLSDATLQARYRDAIHRKITLRPRSTSAAELEREIANVVTELEEEIADLAQEHRRRGLSVDPDPVQKPAQVPSDPGTVDLQTFTEEQLRSRLANAYKELATVSVRSKVGKKLKWETTDIEKELRRRGLPLPIDAEVARMK